MHGASASNSNLLSADVLRRLLNTSRSQAELFSRRLVLAGWLRELDDMADALDAAFSLRAQASSAHTCASSRPAHSASWPPAAAGPPFTQPGANATHIAL
jgi:hypothetical protein